MQIFNTAQLNRVSTGTSLKGHRSPIREWWTTTMKMGRWWLWWQWTRAGDSAWRTSLCKRFKRRLFGLTLWVSRAHQFLSRLAPVRRLGRPHVSDLISFIASPLCTLQHFRASHLVAGLKNAANECTQDYRGYSHSQKTNSYSSCADLSLKGSFTGVLHPMRGAPV